MNSRKARHINYDTDMAEECIYARDMDGSTIVVTVDTGDIIFLYSTGILTCTLVLTSHVLANVNIIQNGVVFNEIVKSQPQ